MRPSCLSPSLFFFCADPDLVIIHSSPHWQHHHGRMDERHRLPHPHWPGVHPEPQRVWPPFVHTRRLCPRGRAQQPPSRERNGEHNFRTVLHRGRTRRSVQSAQLCLSPPHALTAPTVPLGESIASEGKGEYMYVEGRVLDSSGKPVPGAVIETWETDDKGEQKPFCVPFLL